ncbi:MAG: hypothetical protein DMG76_09955 [Acidobacteria bacterium]|nr:MAG: hypothetical protein DMG76_09955 [Acidobacteriota bacterium]
MDTTGNETVLHSFMGPPDGAGPSAGLIMDKAGNLYGTAGGGSYGYGTVFKLDTSGNETMLYSFTNVPDGAYPSAGLIMDKAGNLYGTTTGGGAGNCVLLGVSGCGAVFKLDTTGNETVLYRFTNVPDGTLPYAGLIMDKAGNLYGTTEFGGDGSCDFGVGCGTVFRLDTTGNEIVLYSFMGPPDGAIPLAGLIMDKAGNLYGTTYGGVMPTGWERCSS